jgi:Lysylphosphatidylglycerol synthase TM region
VSRRTLLFIRWGVFLAACAFLYVRLAKHGDVAGLVSVFRMRDTGFMLGALVLVLALMFVNWGLESMKWRVLVRGIEPVSVGEAFTATIAGTSIGMITPNRVGEFVGRVLFLAPENRIPASFATAVGSIAQFVITLVFGTIGFVVMRSGTWEHDGGSWEAIALIGLCGAVAVCSVLLYFNPEILRALVARLPVVRKWEPQAAVFGTFGTRTLLRVLLFSALRYVVFTTQFMIILVALADVWPRESLAVVPVAFLFSSLIPTVMLTELGVRGSVAVALISPHLDYDKGVFLASTTLWLINIALPAMAGAIILLVARIRAARA